MPLPLRPVPRAVRHVLPASIVILAGCTLPSPSYKQVDRQSPAYQAALRAETERLNAESADRSAAETARLAASRAEQQLIADEKDHRTREIAPLLAALAPFQKPRGCWAYTVTTTQLVDGTATVTVESFDPFQPEEKLWTLVTRDGQPPDAKAQENYRATKLRRWKKAQARDPRRRESDYVTRRALSNDLDVVAAGADSPRVTFAFTRAQTAIPLIGKNGAARETFAVDPASGALVQRTRTLLEPSSYAAGAGRMDRFHTTIDYALLDPALPPFVVKTTTRFRVRALGMDSGDVEQECVYSGYRRVTCYDDRFEVQVGSLGIVDDPSWP